jgi:hypothetical protein
VKEFLLKLFTNFFLVDAAWKTKLNFRLIVVDISFAKHSTNAGMPGEGDVPGGGSRQRLPRHPRFAECLV